MSRRFVRMQLKPLWLSILLTVVMPIAARADLRQPICREVLAVISKKEAVYREAERAGIHILSEKKGGFTREKNEQGNWDYVDATGLKVTDADVLQRLQTLGIPPVYKNIWYSEDPLSHLQATAQDVSGKTQYYYHPQWIELAKEKKFKNVETFGSRVAGFRSLLRSSVAKTASWTKQKSLSVLLLIMDQTGIRIGNEEFAEKNETYGLSTMLKTHVEILKNSFRFSFRGKSSKDHVVEVRDEAIKDQVQSLMQIPGENLFQFIDDKNQVHRIHSDDANQLIKQNFGSVYSAKDFRTWIGTRTAAQSLAEQFKHQPEIDSETAIRNAIQSAANVLGNTPSVCRESYIHPRVFLVFRQPELFQHAVRAAQTKESNSKDESFADRLAIEILKIQN